jgi:hypothetical protein
MLYLMSENLFSLRERADSLFDIILSLHESIKLDLETGFILVYCTENKTIVRLYN